MRRTHTVLALTAALCSSLAAQRGERRERPLEEPELRHFTFRVESFETPSLRQREAEYAIYLPAGYDDEDRAEQTYPLAIWLHGMNGSFRRFHDNQGPEILDRLRGEGAIPEFVFVALSASRRPLYLDGLPDGDWEQAIVSDLLGHLEKSYRIAKDRGKRAIMGVSIGGMGALRIGLSHPDVFGAIAAHSAVVPPADVADIDEGMMRYIGRMGGRGGGLTEVLGDPIDPAKWKRISPLALARDLEEAKLRSLRIYFDVGSDDRYRLQPGNDALHALLEERGVVHAFEVVDGGEHSWGSGSTQRQLPKSLQFVGACFEGKPFAEPKPAEAAAEPVEKR